MTLEESLKELRAKYQKTANKTKREIIFKQVRALEIASGKELLNDK